MSDEVGSPRFVSLRSLNDRVGALGGSLSEERSDESKRRNGFGIGSPPSGSLRSLKDP